MDNIDSEVKLNKNGEPAHSTKEKNPKNFANDKELAKKAASNGSLARTIINSSAISTGGTRNHTKQITPELRQFIRDELLAKGKNGYTYVQEFIRNFLKEAKSDMSSNPAKILSNAIFKDDFIQQLDIDAVRNINDKVP